MVSAEKFSEMERAIEKLQVDLGRYEATIDEQKVALLDYIQQEFATTKLGMVEIAEQASKEFGVQRAQLQSLYEATAQELAGINATLAQAQTGKDQWRLIDAKQMLPRV